MVQRGGSEFWVVSCISSGGRPDTDISLALNTDEELQRETNTDSDIQTSSVLLPAAVYEGHNVTCVFDHPKSTHMSRVITLPSFCEYYESFTFQRKTQHCWFSGGRHYKEYRCAFCSADLSGVQLLSSDLRHNSSDLEDTESLELQEGQNDTVISLQVAGNVPHYNVTCKR